MTTLSLNRQQLGLSGIIIGFVLIILSFFATAPISWLVRIIGLIVIASSAQRILKIEQWLAQYRYRKPIIGAICGALLVWMMFMYGVA